MSGLLIRGAGVLMLAVMLQGRLHAADEKRVAPENPEEPALVLKLSAGDPMGRESRVLWARAYAFEYGRGVPADIREAVKLYRLSAQRGELTALEALSRLYLEGKGVQKNLVISHALALVASDRGAVADGEVPFEAPRALGPAGEVEARALAEALREPGRLLINLDRYQRGRWTWESGEKSQTTEKPPKAAK